MTTPQHKDTTLDEILRLLSGTSYDIAAENRNVGELLEAETKAKQALLQWRDKAVVEALQSVLNEYANQYQNHAADMGRTETPFTIFHKIINNQLKETPNED